MSIILYQRLNKSNQYSPQKVLTPSQIQAKDENDSKDMAVSSTSDKVIHPKYIITEIQIKEHIYSRKVFMSVSYFLTASLEQLIDASGMFSPVDTSWVGTPYGKVPKNLNSPDHLTNPGQPAHALHNQWRLWACNTQTYQNIKGYRNVNMPDVSLIFDPLNEAVTRITAEELTNLRRTPVFPVTQFIKEMPRTERDNESISDPDEVPGLVCYFSTKSQGKPVLVVGEDEDTVLIGRGKTSSPGTPDGEGSDQSAYFKELDPEKSYFHYSNEFEIEEDTHTLYLPKVETQDTQSMVATTKENSSKRNKGFNLHGSDKTKVSRYTLSPVQTVAKPTYRVRMQGMAIRAGWAAPVPVLLSVQQNQGSNVSASDDQDKVIPFRVGTNRTKHLQISQSADIPIYLTMWDITYALDGDPRCTDLKFNSNTPAEFV
jgi:hypothetical protein